jgi:hypothetical protein
MKIRLLATIFLFPGLLPAAFSSPIMAPVLYKKGGVTATAPGGSITLSDKGGELPEKTAVQTSPGGVITFMAYPGGAVKLDESTNSSIQHLEVLRANGHIQRRAALMRLDAGRLFYSILKFQNKATQFQVTTPDRVVAVREKKPKPGGTDVAGMVDIKDKKTYATILAGSASISSAGGQAITVDAGSLYSSDGAHITVLNLITGNFSTYDESGNLLDSRNATGPELLAGRTDFQFALGVAEVAIEEAGLDPSMATAISHTISQINTYLASNNIPSLSTEGIGSAPTNRLGSVLPSMNNASTANPANVSGVVRSGER